MVRIPNYFYSTDTDKQTLHRRITPSQEQSDNQKVRWNDLCEFLIDRLKEKTDYQVKSWIQGSYKLGTQTRPANKKDEFDIDLGLYFLWDGDSNEGIFSAKEIKDFIQEELKNFKDENNDVVEILDPPKERCSRIKFNDSFHVDVPSYHLDEKNNIRELATESNIWENSDPKAFYIWFRDKFSNEDCNQIRRLIRYFKILSRLHLKNPPSSVQLTVLISEAYVSCSSSEVDGDDLAIKSVTERIISRLKENNKVINPVNSSENLNRLNEDDFSNFLGLLNKIIDTADVAIESDSEASSSIIWGKVFNHFFPISDSYDSSAGEKSLIPMKFVPEVSIVVNSVKSGTYFHKKGRNEIRSIPKDCNIQFSLINYDQLPAGSSVSWIVRNEGVEAEYKNDLGHIANINNKPFISKEELSGYFGTHYMDISITSAIGEIIGFRRILVEISGQYIPPRNMPRKFNGPKK